MCGCRITWLIVALLLYSPAARAQLASGGIAGVVRDTSGALLPGVTVEAASPALIEKIRTVVTDGEGRYSIVDLRSGVYSVTFTLPGFSTFRREGIELTGGFTATVNAEMRVGALEETVTVTGQSPVVDTQNVRQQSVLPDTLISSLPSGLRAYSSLARLIPGTNVGDDAGGANGLFTSFFISAWTRHGVGGARILFDGMSMQNVTGSSRNTSAMNPSTVQETIVELGGISAESNSNGLTFNMIPKDGSNVFQVGASGTFTNKNLQADNLPPDLAARGAPTTEKISHFYDVHLTVGGPIKRDRVWFFAATRATGLKTDIVGLYFNKTIGTPFYTPDFSRPAYRLEWDKSQSARISWQISPRNKINGFAFPQTFQQRGGTAITAEEASTSFGLHREGFWPSGLWQISWTAPVTSKFLLEAGASVAPTGYPLSRANIQNDLGIPVRPTDIAIREASTGFLFNAKATYSERNLQDRYAERLSASYITGSHAFKVGMQTEQAFVDRVNVTNSDQSWVFNRGVPSQIIQYATPYQQRTRFTELGLFAQDRWTIKRLTLTYGLRFDYFHGYTLAEDGTLSMRTDTIGNPIVPPLFVAPRAFPKVDNVPKFTDLDPRLGMGYDMFGTGRTALKAYLGRYLSKSSIQIPEALHPVATAINSVTRVWNDTDGNFVPDCDLKNFAANGECQAINNVNFGQHNPNAVQYADDLIRGFGKRDYFWEGSAEVQQQIGSRVAVTAGFYRTWTDHFGTIAEGWPTGVSHNLSQTPADFSPYCVTAPVDPLLPGGGGYQVCGLYDVSPAKFGKGQIQVDRASKFGGKSRVSNFVTISMNTRLGGGRELGGSLDTGRTVEDQCFVADTPQQRLNCHIVTPFRAQTQIKVHGSYPLPAGFVASAVLQNVSGAEYEANWAVPSSLIAPSLGRNLSACGAQAVCSAAAVVPLVVPQTQFEPRRTVLDVRGSRLFRVGSKQRLRANVDFFNVLNRSDLVTLNSTYGPQWRIPIGSIAALGMLGGRTIQIGGELTF